MSSDTYWTPGDVSEETPSQKQKRKEEYLIENVSPCSKIQLDIIKDNFRTLKNTVFEEIVRKKFFNENTMKVAECTISSLFYLSPYDFGSITLDYRIVSYKKNRGRISRWRCFFS